jgi:hypothetical protein
MRVRREILYQTQCIVASLRPSLPNMQIMQDMWSRVWHRRVPFKDGWLDTNTLQFHPLPYPRHLLVTQPALSITYQELMAVGHYGQGPSTSHPQIVHIRSYTVPSTADYGHPQAIHIRLGPHGVWMNFAHLWMKMWIA